jgi:glycine/D-amino acid oxidase-like deaminating enzyme
MDADVIVVGAGLAGLRCARVLQDAGREVVVLESAPHVGGRVTSEDVDGFVVDRGFQVLNPSYPAVRRWVDVAALGLEPFDAGVLVRTDTGLRVVADPRRTPRLALDTLRSGLLDARELWGLGRWLAPVLARPQTTVAGPDSSLAQVLDERGVRGDLRRVLQRFLAGVVVEPDGTTSAQFVRLLLRSFALGRPALPEGGMRRLPEQLASGLADVRTGVRVEAVRTTVTGMSGVDTAGGSLTARQVVLATDAFEAGRLSGQPPVAMNGLTTWWFAADDAPDTRRMLVVDARGEQAPPGPVWNAAVVSVVAPSYAPAGRHLVEATTLLARPDGRATQDEVLAHLADLYSCDTSRWEVVAHHVIPDAVPASPPPLRLTRPVALGHGLFVCGDHRDTSSIQGALVSGQRAARAVLEVR